MAEITARMVADLRATTGLGMMECKKALVEAEGDAKKAEEILRVKSGAKASKVAGRTAAEGAVVVYTSGKIGALVEVNCETDFVAKDDNFLAYARRVAEVIVESDPLEAAALAGMPIEDTRKEVIAKLGENISVRRFVRYETDGLFGSYVHGGRIGVLVDLSGGDEALAKDIAMHIAAARPVCVSKDEVSPDLIETERRIYTEQARQTGKPAEIIAKMVEGRVTKYLADVTLLGQNFVKNPDVTIEQLLKDKSASVSRFTAFTVGEGIEKKEVDFAAEVAAATKA